MNSNRPPKSFFYTLHPWGKSTKVLFQNWQNIAYQTSSNRSKTMKIWSIWWCVVYRFLPILTQDVFLFFWIVLATKKLILHDLKMDYKKPIQEILHCVWFNYKVYTSITKTITLEKKNTKNNKVHHRDQVEKTNYITKQKYEK